MEATLIGVRIDYPLRTAPNMPPPRTLAYRGLFLEIVTIKVLILGLILLLLVSLPLSVHLMYLAW